MTNRGYNYRFDISRIVIGRNIKEITSTNNGGDGAINITNNFSIIFLPRENSSDSIKLKRYAFSGCRGLKDISFTNYMEIETNSLAGIGITYLDLSPILNYNIINHQTITGLSNLKSVNFGNITSISNYNFTHCNKLEYISIPSNITDINYFSFTHNRSLKTIKFYSSTKLVNPGTHTSITHFSNCPNLQLIILDDISSYGIGDYNIFKNQYNAVYKFKHNIDNSNHNIFVENGLFNYYTGNENYTSTWNPVKTSKLVIVVNNNWKTTLSYVDDSKKSGLRLSSFQLKVDISEGYINYPWKDTSINGLYNPFYESSRFRRNIGINFIANSVGATRPALATDDPHGVIPSNYWNNNSDQSTENVSVFNNSANRITTSVNLIDNTNNQTPTSLKIKNAYGAYYAHRNDNLKILFNYLEFFNQKPDGDNFPNFTLENITYSVYDVIVYTSTKYDIRAGKGEITAKTYASNVLQNNVTIYHKIELGGVVSGEDPLRPGITDGYVGTNSNTNGYPSANYLHFSNLTGDKLELIIPKVTKPANYGDGTEAVGIAGIQIIEIYSNLTSNSTSRNDFYQLNQMSLFNYKKNNGYNSTDITYINNR